MKHRLVAASATALALALTVSGCNIMTPAATTVQYDASEGVSGTTGLIGAYNAVIVVDEDDSERGNFAVTFVNKAEATNLVITVGDDVQDVDLDAGTTVYGFDDDQIVVQLAQDVIPGSTVNVALQADGAEPVGLQVPVLSTEYRDYASYGPTPSVTPAPTAPATQEPFETAGPAETAETEEP